MNLGPGNLLTILPPKNASAIYIYSNDSHTCTVLVLSCMVLKLVPWHIGLLDEREGPGLHCHHSSFDCSLPGPYICVLFSSLMNVPYPCYTSH